MLSTITPVILRGRPGSTPALLNLMAWGGAASACCSAAGENNYPWKTRMTSTYDVGLPDATADHEYLRILADWLPRLLDRHRPQLAFFQAGVDAMQDDSFGRRGLIGVWDWLRDRVQFRG